MGRPGEAFRRVVASERAFVLAVGGFSIELPGASLVTNERVPVPAFNYGQIDHVGRERQAAFFERALDHYFQRALRPSFRAPAPAPAHIDAGLRHFGFVPTESPLVVLESSGSVPTGARAPEDLHVEAVGAEEIDRILPFWAGPRDRDELRRALEVALVHANPGERLVPWVAEKDGRDRSAAILYEEDGAIGLHAVATQPEARGGGAATELVRRVLESERAAGSGRIGMVVPHRRIAARLETLGFEVVGELVAYELPPAAELHIPPPGPPTPPRWRPPRRPPAASGSPGAGGAAAR
ncbi:MAG TPA: GNAT family N-acetyltransferase [Thermoplasmata archaeon]|nr:GNAT family N-acetyltransferase [Thermoplasmata archaeon]